MGVRLTVIWAALVVFEPGIARAEDSIGLCPRCDLLVGVGARYRLFGWSDGLVVPLTLELDENRWELGAFRWTRTAGCSSWAYATGRISGSSSPIAARIF
jgi:hypothetical protein